MLLTGREIEIIAVAVVAIAAALNSRSRWKRKANQYKAALNSRNTELLHFIDSYSKVRDELHYIRPRHNRIINEMRELCRERSNPSKVENIINRWVKNFNNPNP